MSESVIKFKKLNSRAEIPTYAHDGDIGMDVKCTSVTYDRLNDVFIYGTGLACETTNHMGVLGMMKSSIYKKGDCYLTNGVGLIDSDQYRGEIKFVYRSRLPLAVRVSLNVLETWNERSFFYRLFHCIYPLYLKYRVEAENEMLAEYAPYKVGEVCGQLVPLSFDKVAITEVEELSKTERGEGGFGSTEKKKRKKLTK